jgi:hypothetical protein
MYTDFSETPAASVFGPEGTTAINTDWASSTEPPVHLYQTTRRHVREDNFFYFRLSLCELLLFFRCVALRLSSPTFRRHILPPSSGWNRKSSGLLLVSLSVSLIGLLFKPEHGDSKFLRNMSEFYQTTRYNVRALHSHRRKDFKSNKRQ